MTDIPVGTLAVCGVFVVAGLVSACAAVCNWDWFFKSSNAQMLTGRFSRRTGRVVYFVLGCLILLMAVALLKEAFAQSATLQ